MVDVDVDVVDDVDVDDDVVDTVVVNVLDVVDVVGTVVMVEDCVELVVVVGATTQLPPRQLPLVAFTTQPVPLANTGPLKQIPLLHMPSCRQTPE